ncbi:UDP-N-acetyl-D-glucosamine 2-epimerase, UDP-hydrolysing [Candidatus Magnetoovum chiemensis]|nr:UDP-N-acetyl-D-glucosamine 2-epimerase, UDP-hydrolysing [Candidatus Magnetoovum chiemensis]
MRKIAAVTGTRAEYGLLYWILKGIYDDPQLKLQLIVTGTHLCAEFGMTVREIEKDGFPISEKVEMLLSSDTETAIATSMGLGMIGFAKAYERLKPDILLVLGDRFEILSAVAAALPFRIPVAHIHGGESTEGAIDEAIRHAVTKMSHIHFTSTETYRNRVVQLGERPEKVFSVGAPGIDNVYNLNLLEKDKLYSSLDIPLGKKIGIVTYHPVTLENDTAEFQISELLKALTKYSDVYWVFTSPNADTGGRIIIDKIKNFLITYPEKGKLFHSLGQLRYISLLKYSDLMVGNSSSGIIEAPSFKMPVVNIGDRQSGRVHAENVINVPQCLDGEISAALNKALSDEYRNGLKSIRNPYGDGLTSEKIIRQLKEITLDENLIKKRFYEVPNDKRKV